MAMGTWWVKSPTDPRWNVSGHADVGMFMQLEQCAPAQVALMKVQIDLNEIPPDDLEFGYMKD